MNQEDWIKELRKRADTWQEPVPDALWDSIESRLDGKDVTGGSGLPQSRPMLRRHLWASAAAVALLIVSVVGLLAPDSPVVADRVEQEGGGVPSVKKYTVSNTADNLSTGVVASAARPVAMSFPAVKAALNSPASRGVSPDGAESVVSIAVGDAAQDSCCSQETPADSLLQHAAESLRADSLHDKAPSVGGRTYHGLHPRRDGYSAAGHSVASSGRGRSRRLSLGLVASNNLAGGEVGSSPMIMAPVHMRSPSARPSASASGVMNGGEPVYLYNCSSTTDHKQPVSFGMLVSYSLGQRISLESGITYTYLRSDFTQQAGTHRTVDIQRLHYLGIPLHASLDIVRLRPLTLYCTMGVEADFCVSATMTTASRSRHISRDRAQFSLFGSLGLRCAIGSGFSVFGEYGEHYTLDNGNMLVNYFDANRHYGVLRMGINYEL